MMLHIPEVLTSTQVAEIRQKLDASDWVDGKATVGAQGAQVKRNRQLHELSPVGMELGQIILKALVNNPLFFAAALPMRYMPPLFNRYEGGEHYGFILTARCERSPAQISACVRIYRAPCS